MTPDSGTTGDSESRTGTPETEAAAAEAIRLYEAERERLLLLAEASNTLLSRLDPGAIIAAVLDLSRRLFQADAYAIWRRSPETGGWQTIADAGLSEEYPRSIPTSAQGMPATPLTIEDVDQEPILAGRTQFYATEAIRSLLCVPLCLHGEHTGTITLYYRRPRQFQDTEVRTAVAFANLAAAALSTAELYQQQRAMRAEAETAQRRLAFLAEASTVLASSLDYEMTLKHVAQLVVPHLADWCVVHLLPEEGPARQVAVAHVDHRKVEWARTLEARYPYDAEASQGIANVLRTGQAELYPEITDAMLVASARDAEHLEVLRQVGFHSCLIVPLRVRSQVFGAITFIGAESGVRYDEKLMELVEDLAQRIATAIDNARLYREAQAALVSMQRSEARFRRLVEANVIGIHFGDIHGSITDANDAFLRMVGYTREELEAGRLHWDRLTAPEYRDLDRRAAEESRRAGACVPFEKEFLRKDGTRVPVLMGAALFPEAPDQGVAFALDLTDLKRAQEGVRYAMEHAHCLIWHAYVEPTADGRAFQWTFTFFDEQAAHRFLPLELLPGETYAEAFYRSKPPEDQKLVDVTAKRAFQEGRHGYRQEYRCRRRDGVTRWLAEETHLEPLGPGRWRAVGVCIDVTERRELEEALRQRVQDLAAADRRKDEFLAMLAHELRNPLGAISNAVHLLQAGHGQEAVRRRALEVLQRQVRHQARMVDDLLDVSRLTRGLVELNQEPLDLARLARETVEDYRAAMESAGLSLAVELPGEPLRVHGDPIRLVQVVGNLLSNALKFTDPGGRVTVRAGADAASARAVLTVRDTGVGIPPDLLPNVFETFIQGDRTLARSRGGLGLGLAIVRDLIRLHGGEVWASSGGTGQGAEFSVALPLAASGGEAPLAEATPAEGRQPLRVLLIEDNRDAAETLRDLLEMRGYQVEVALNGPAGIQAARRLAPDVVLCDIGLPGMDGYEVAAALKRDPPTAAARLVALTGYAGDEEQRRSRESGFERHLVKPVDPDELDRILASAP